VADKVRVAKTVIPPKRRTIPAAAPDSDDALRHARLFVAAAERELSNGNVVAAAAQLKLARSCCDTPEIRKAYEAVEEQAKVRRLELQLAVCTAAEKDSRWADAVEAYSKAYATSASARVAERWANALRLSEGDLRLAAKMAEEAVQAEPQNGSYHATLGEVYADAGLERRAQAEARRALELLPSDPRAQALVSRLQKRERERERER
jgi:tetratricopeptide (TPR) repeat protein